MISEFKENWGYSSSQFKLWWPHVEHFCGKFDLVAHVREGNIRFSCHDAFRARCVFKQSKDYVNKSQDLKLGGIQWAISSWDACAIHDLNRAILVHYRFRKSCHVPYPQRNDATSKPHFIYRLIDWSIDRLNHRLIDPLNYWLMSWLVSEWSIEWLVGYLHIPFYCIFRGSKRFSSGSVNHVDHSLLYSSHHDRRLSTTQVISVSDAVGNGREVWTTGLGKDV